MTDRSNAANNNTPLFQNMDEQEQAYAPQQLPGADQSDAAGDVAGDAGIDTVAMPAVTAGGITGTSAGGAGAGTGAAPIAPVVPVRRDLMDDDTSSDTGASR